MIYIKIIRDNILIINIIIRKRDFLNNTEKIFIFIYKYYIKDYPRSSFPYLYYILILLLIPF